MADPSEPEGRRMPTVAQHFDRAAPHVRETYHRLLERARACGPFEEDPKKTSIHLNRRTAFAGVATRKEALILTLKASTDRASARIVKQERASANRWHLEIRLERPEDVDAEIARWLADAYALSE